MFPESISCPWSTEQLPLRFGPFNIPESARQFAIYWSGRMGYGKLWPEPTDAELSALYNTDSYAAYLSTDSYAAYLPGSTSEQKPAARSFASRIVIKIAYLADRGTYNPLPTIQNFLGNEFSCCDVGCGSGSFLEIVRDRGEVCGIDPSPISLQKLSDRRIKGYAGTADTLPEGVDKYDLVTMFHSLEHVRDPLVSLRNMRKITKRLFVVEVPNMACLGFDKLAERWFHADPGRHLHYFTEQSLRNLLERVGFKHLATEYVGFVAQFVRDPPLRPFQLYSALLPERKKYDTVRVYAR